MITSVICLFGKMPGCLLRFLRLPTFIGPHLLSYYLSLLSVLYAVSCLSRCLTSLYCANTRCTLANVLYPCDVL
ncbi:hypothetical protein BS47DRAFT_51784 [Hydnum rufescens UP504]|uniref:Uncharacterized protein n=1 Tax=Hydnum rufescens UP504 TaxID=1448309 RepID=A0A9P6AS65_9AGAM|nr:hypothetical protein BS47DRAFT_51784 [Hydnum rufescens UP504]